MKEINHALVEEARPSIYTAMKYWGKKPHNIWREYIKTYTENDGIYLDPFCGSAISAFESYKANRKAIVLDINPLSSFIVETYTTNFNEEIYIKTVKRIVSHIQEDKVYKSYYCYNGNLILQNCKWESGEIYEACFISQDKKRKYVRKCTKKDISVAKALNKITIKNKYPKFKFRDEKIFTAAFRKKVGSNYADIFTKRNLYVLSLLFDQIIKIDSYDLRMQLLFSFIQIVHLSSKMCSPRSKVTNRDFSTSWGRPAYLSLSKQMEMNPLLLFEKSCLYKQSTLNVFKEIKNYFVNKPIIKNINEEMFNAKLSVDIWYGIWDIKKLKKIIPKSSVSFVMTDPPYGGVIQYLDLSNVWLSWLSLIDKKYIPNYEEEIIINTKKNNNSFGNDMYVALKNIYYVLKKDGTLVLTFNNKDSNIWGSFFDAIYKSGFCVKKIIHQQNRRSGESNVSSIYGTSGTDYYIYCKKEKISTRLIKGKEEIEKIIVKKAKYIILKRKEPTPFKILCDELLPLVTKDGIDFRYMNASIEKVLNNNLKNYFEVYKKNCSSGDLWWIKDMRYNKNNKDTLTNRVGKFARDIIKNYPNQSTDEIVNRIFSKYRGCLTPDIKTVNEMIKRIKKDRYGKKRREI